MQDAWLATGHYSLPFECERWKTPRGRIDIKALNSSLTLLTRRKRPTTRMRTIISQKNHPWKRTTQHSPDGERGGRQRKL